jgi:urease accessory protein
MLLCEEILGTLSDEKFAGLEVDYVDIEWHEAFKKLHKKKSHGGREIGVQLGNYILKKGLNQDDVLAVDGNTAIAVNIPETLAYVIDVDDVHMATKVCYEIGNTHATVFWGDSDFQYVVPQMVQHINKPMKALMEKLGVKVELKSVKLDFQKSISSSINAHTH